MELDPLITVAGWLRGAVGGEVVSFDAIDADRGPRGGQGIPGF